MKMDETVKQIMDNSIPLEETPEEIIDLAGYQVTRAELFAHSREPSITFWISRMKFNMACLRRFPGVRYVQILIDPDEKRMIIRPCTQDTPDCLRWATGGGEKEIKNRDMQCKVFAEKVYDLMEWKPENRYNILGKPATYEGEFLFLFKLNDFELFVNSRSKGSYLPENWRDYFGMPADRHDEEYRVNLAEGFITTDKI